MLHYLILVHKDNTYQLNQLINRLFSPNSKIYVHVDKKTDISRLLFLENKVSFIQKRTNIKRSGFSMIKATLSSYKQIFPNMKPGDHLILMSGQDLPLKSQKNIIRFFRDNSDKSFINYEEDPNNNFNLSKHLTRYYFNDRTIPSIIDKKLGKYIETIARKLRIDIKTSARRRQIFSGIINRIARILPPQRYLITNYKQYGGSQRHALTWKHVKYILDFLDTKRGKTFYKAFKYTNCPDERFFQILLLNSPHKYEIENRLLRYVRRTEGSRSPDILSEKDIKILKESGKLFARKFDTKSNPEIVHQIDKLYMNKDDIGDTNMICFLSDKDTPTTLKSFDKIEEAIKEIGKKRDIVFLFHKKSIEVSKEINRRKHFIFTNNILSELGYTPIEQKLVPGSNHFPILKFYTENPNYDYYWCIEDDVRFNGNRDGLFKYFEECHDDFIACNIEKYKENKGWYRRNIFKNTKGSTYKKNKRIKSFNPIYRISNSALAHIHKSLINGRSGHHEIIIPTLLYNKGYTISDFGGIGGFVPQGQENKFYTKKSMTHIPIKLGKIENRLYHPIKE